MKIEKTATNPEHFLTNTYYYNQARDAMNDLFQTLVSNGLIQNLLLPGYIGWSPKEGSGIFDSVKTIPGLNIIYYQMNGLLQIETDDLKNCLALYPQSAVLIVNYFGFRDCSYHEICNIIQNHKAYIIEDNAHGFFTYYNNHFCKADATVFSYHKMFPVTFGGGLKLLTSKLMGIHLNHPQLHLQGFCEWDYDIIGITETRKENYKYLDNLIRSHQYYREALLLPIRSIQEVDEGNVPQTYPVQILKGNRNEIYQIMNNYGFGVVSLYHTLIPELNDNQHINARKLSKTILNLPVHQDVNTDNYEAMVDLLYELCMETIS